MKLDTGNKSNLLAKILFPQLLLLHLPRFVEPPDPDQGEEPRGGASQELDVYAKYYQLSRIPNSTIF